MGGWEGGSRPLPPAGPTESSPHIGKFLRVRSLRLDFFPLENFSAGIVFFPLEIFPSGSTFLPLKNAFFETNGQQRFIIFLITGQVKSSRGATRNFNFQKN